MEKENVTITVLGEQIYSGPWNPEKVYEAEAEAFRRLADKDFPEDACVLQHLEDAAPVIREVAASSAQMQEFFWQGNGSFHGPGWVALEELEGYLMERFKLRYTQGLGAVIA